jgi:anion-transporting  ArsA/GET3 family ATPase
VSAASTWTVASLAHAVGGKQVVICCGSGGVGKTTVAAALGEVATRRTGGRVLVLTIDPAKRLANALGLEAVGNTERRVELGPGATGELWVAMLDTSASWDDLVRSHAADAATAAKILANPLYRNITQRFVQSHDYIAMERLYELRAGGQYDLIVIDTPPSRHALDFLDAPERMADFFSSNLLKWITMPYRIGGARAGRLGYLAAKPFYQAADRILGSQFLQDIAEFFLLFQSMYAGFVQRAKAVTGLLHDQGTTFVVVSSLEPAPLHEAEFFMQELDRRSLRLGALVLNRVLPPYFLDPKTRAAATRITTSSVAERKGFGTAEEQRVLGSVADSFLRFATLADHEQAQRRRLARQPEAVVTIPLQDRDITDLGALASLGDRLWPASAPLAAGARRRTSRPTATG